jgi:hypothetical protein
MIKKKLLKSLSSIMFFTGSKSNDNALAAENRNYGYEDETLGTLNKDKDYNLYWSYMSDEKFSENPTNWTTLNDIYDYAYTYISTKSESKPINEYYLNNDIIFNFKYNYDNNFNSNIENNNIIPLSDINLMLQSMNNAMFNKQQHYKGKDEIDFMFYDAIKYNWYGEGSYIYESYTNNYVDISNNFLTYELNTYTVQATVWNSTTSSYELAWQDIKDEATGEVIGKEPLMTNKYSLKNINKFDKVIIDKLTEITNDFKEKFVWDSEFEDKYSYNISELNSQINLFGESHSFGFSNIKVNLNYDSQFNNWFKNKVSFDVDNLETEKDINLLDIVVGKENSWTNIIKNETDKVCGNDINISGAHSFVINNNLETSLNLGLLNPQSIKEINFTNIADKLVNEIDMLSEYKNKIDFETLVDTNWNKEYDNVLEKLIINNDANKECNITNIIGLEYLNNLKQIDLLNCNKLNNSLNLKNLSKLNIVNAKGSNLKVFETLNQNKFENVILPVSIESISLQNKEGINNLFIESIENLKSFNLINSTIDNLKIKELNENEFEFESNNNEHLFINYWLTNLKNQNKLSSGNVNFINLEGVNWTNVSIDTLEMLKIVELNRLTGEVQIDGSYNENKDLFRNEYQKLIKLFGNDPIYKENNDLKFNININENAFKVKFEFITEEEYDGEKIYNILDFIETDLIDNTAVNSLLDMMQASPELFENLTFEDFHNNNKQKVGLTFKLNKSLELTNKSEKFDSLQLGDILLYNDNKIVIINKDTENINTNFIKLGNLTTKLSEILFNLSEYNKFYISIKSLE